MVSFFQRRLLTSPATQGYTGAGKGSHCSAPANTLQKEGGRWGFQADFRKGADGGFRDLPTRSRSLHRRALEPGGEKLLCVVTAEGLSASLLTLEGVALLLQSCATLSSLWKGSR